MGRELGKSLFDPQLRLVWGRRGGKGEGRGGKRPESNFLSLLLLLAERDQANFLAEAAWDELGKQERRGMETFFPSSLFFLDPFAFAFTCSGEPLALSQTSWGRGP